MNYEDQIWTANWGKNAEKHHKNKKGKLKYNKEEQKPRIFLEVVKEFAL